MELSQGEIIQKRKLQELYSLFVIHRLNVMHASVKFHEYIPYILGVMARTQSGTYGQMDGGTEDKQDGQGITLNALPLFYEKAGA